ISQMYLRCTHHASGGLRLASTLSSRALPAVNGKVSWQMGRGLIGGIDVAPFLRQDHMKQLDGLRPAFFSPIIPETHVVSTLNQVLHDPFPEVVGECHPIDLRLSIALKKRLGVWVPDKDEIALFGCQHHLIPIDHKHLTRSIADQISCMQIRVTDDVWPCPSLKHSCQLFQGGHCRVNRGLMRHPVGAKSARRSTSIMSRMEVLSLKGTYPSGILCRIKGLLSQ